jgi:hypothetical protein
MLNPKVHNFLHFIERLWAFLPGGRVMVMDLLVRRELTEEEFAHFRLYRDALLGMTGVLLLVVLHPRLWTLALGVPIFLGCLYYRVRQRQLLIPMLSAQPPTPPQGEPSARGMPPSAP